MKTKTGLIAFFHIPDIVNRTRPKSGAPRVRVRVPLIQDILVVM